MVFAQTPQGRHFTDAGYEVVIDEQAVGILLRQHLANLVQVLAKAQVEVVQAVEQDAVVQQAAWLGTQHQYPARIRCHFGDLWVNVR
ncbi:hypothetical protein D3C78_1491560 [compost metagenome]